MFARPTTVLGHRLRPPRPTLMAALLAFGYLIAPVLFVGGALDLAAQQAFGVCTGLWCVR